MSFHSWYQSIYPVTVEADIFKLLESAWEQSKKEEREACVQKAALWALTKDMSSNLRLGLASAIRGRTADPKDEEPK